MKDLSFVDFRKFANERLNIIKEETSNQYAEYVMKNFGKLTEDVDTCKLMHIAKYNDIDELDINILKRVVYEGDFYDYFIHDTSKCIGVDKDGKIIYIGDYNENNLTDGNVMESKGK